MTEMRKIIVAWLVICAALFSAGHSSAQMVGEGVWKSSYDPATKAWVNAVVTAGGTVSVTQESNVNTLIIGLKADGLFTILDRVWLLHSENTYQAGIDIIKLGTFASITGSPTFAAFGGYTFSGSNYIDTGFYANGGSQNYSLNSASVFTYISTSDTTYQHFPMGWDDTVQGTEWCPGATAGTGVAYVNSVTAFNTTQGNLIGFTVLTRTAASAGDVYWNGTALNPTFDTSTSVPTLTIWVGALNWNGSLHSGYSAPDAFKIVGIGGGLNSAQAGNLYTLIENYLAATLDPATTAWVNAVVTAGGTVSTAQKVKVDTLIRGLKADGLFSVLDRVWLFASENTQQAGIDIINLGTLTEHGSPTFTAGSGYAFSGSNYLDTGIILASESRNYTLNSASSFVYIPTSYTTFPNTPLGTYDGTNSGPYYTAGAAYINDTVAFTTSQSNLQGSPSSAEPELVLATFTKTERH